MHHNLTNYKNYLRVVQLDKNELDEMINQITTNETYFFREQVHFDFLKEYSLKNYMSDIRIWSAASSVGAEAYSMAMVLDDIAKKNWNIIGTDINSIVIKKARVGLYPKTWIEKIPTKYIKKYCLKGKNKYDKQFLIDRRLSANIKFIQ